MEETKTITLKIVQRDYDVRVKRNEEDLFLQACDSIKESLQFYAQKSAHRDKQDLMAMLLLQAFVTNLRQEKQLKNGNVSEQDIKKAKDIDNLLDQVLNLRQENYQLSETVETEAKQMDTNVMDDSTKITEIDIYRKVENENKTDELTLF
ncbi:MAG: hypothetical protein Q4Q06_01260 [Bacteroidota bacterium]|nr:hypothetical protein [Bacteroidota bacterium]